MVKLLAGGGAALVIVVVLVELWLRLQYGLGNPPLYMADARTGYRLVPNQRLQRRGNRIAINQYSMRGDDLQPQRPAATLRVLMLGDSIVNGGWWTDQSELLSLKLQAALTTLMVQEPSRFPDLDRVEVLNASANSWGPRNELGYVLRFGTFEAQTVLLLLNTDDLFAIAPNSYELGRHPGYPTRRPPLALWEAIRRRRPYHPSPELQALHDQPGDRVGVNLESLRQLQQTVLAADGRLVMAMTPLRRELESGPRDYEIVARQRLVDFAAAQGIPYLDLLPLFEQSPYESFYFDHIHLSAEGNQVVGQALAKLVISPGQLAPGHSQKPSDETITDLW